MQQEVDVTLGPAQWLAVDLDAVDSGVGFRAEFSDGLSIDRDQAAGNEFFGLAPRRDSGGGDDFLQALSWHGYDFSDDDPGSASVAYVPSSLTARPPTSVCSSEASGTASVTGSEAAPSPGRCSPLVSLTGFSAMIASASLS